MDIFLSQDITYSLDDLVDTGTPRHNGLWPTFSLADDWDTARLGGMAGASNHMNHMPLSWHSKKNRTSCVQSKHVKTTMIKKNLRFPWRKSGRCTRITFGETKTWQNPWGIPSPSQDHHAGPSRAVEACPRFSASSAGPPTCPKTQKIRPASLIESEICWVQGGKETS